MVNKHWVWHFSGIFLLIITGCSPAKSETVGELPTLIDFPSETASFTPSSTTTASPTAIPTTTAIFTATPPVTNSPSPSATRTQSPSPVPTITASSTITPTSRPLPTSTITPSPVPTATIAVSPLPSGETYYANNGDVRVRTCPRRDCETLRVMQLGETVVVIGTTTGDTVFNSNRWYEVNHQGRLGYVHSSLLVTELPQPTSAPINQPPPITGTCSCSVDLDCGDFTSQSGAQACYSYCLSTTGRDVHNLDGNDNDGLACDSYDY